MEKKILSSIFVNPHPIIELQITNLKKDESGWYAECILYNADFKEVESSFFLDEERATGIINLMQDFLKKCEEEEDL